MDNPEKTVGEHKKGQPRENRRGTLCVPAVFSGLSFLMCPSGFLWIVHPCVPLVFSGFSALVCPYSFLWIVHPCVSLLFYLDCPLLCAPTVFSGLSTFVNTRKDNPEKTVGDTRLDNPEKTIGAHKGGQSRENCRDTQGRKIQRKLGAHKGGQFSLDCPFLCVPTVFSGLSTLVCPCDFLWVVLSHVPLRFSLDCPPLCAPTVFSELSTLVCPCGLLWAHKGGQSRENRRGTQERTTQRKP
jgi:hypothetical protein